MAIAAVPAVAAAAPWVMGGLAVASAGMQYMQGRQQAEQAEAYQKVQNEQALQSMQSQYSQLSASERDSQLQSLDDSLDNQTQAAQTRGKVNAMAAASGTGGLSINGVLSDINQQEGRNLSQISRNRSIDAFNLRQQAQSVRYGTAANMDHRKIHKPSAISTGINLAASGVSGYTSGLQTGQLINQASISGGV